MKQIRESTLPEEMHELLWHYAFSPPARRIEARIQGERVKPPAKLRLFPSPKEAGDVPQPLVRKES